MFASGSSGDRLVWQRLDPGHLWANVRTRTVLTWKELISRGVHLREQYLDLQVWVVRGDGQIPTQLYGIYSNEPAAVAAAAGQGHRVQPWQVVHEPGYHTGQGGLDGTDA